MKRLSALSVLLLLLVNLHITTGQEKRNYTDPLAKRSEISKDDTKFVQALINKARPGDTVVLRDSVYHLRTIRLRSHVSLHSKAVFRQLPPDSAENFTWAKQYSDYPLFYGDHVKDVHLRFREAFTYGEAVLLDSCDRISISDTKVTGDSSKLRSFAGIYLSHCRQIRMNRVDVAYYGMKRKSPSYYQRGTGIRVQTCLDIRISKSNIHDNGENGIFLHGSGVVNIHHNYIHHNGMSGVQVAFGRSGREHNYQITDNNLVANAADAIDINNPDPSRPVVIMARIEGNTSTGNGWVKGLKTRDGSGIATLVGLKEVLVRNNRSANSNRPAVYIRECDKINVINNKGDNFAEIVGEEGYIRLFKNTFSGLRLLRDLNAGKLVLDSNSIGYLEMHDGIRVDSLVFMANHLRGNMNVNMDGGFIFKDNVLSSKSPRGALSLWKVNGAVLTGNQISADTTGDALYIHDKAMNVVIQANQILASNACIRDGGSPQLMVIQNTLTSKVPDDSTLSLISSNPKELLLRNNRFSQGTNGKILRRIGIEGAGSVTMDSESRKLL